MKKLQPKVKKQQEVTQEPKLEIDYNNYQEQFYIKNAPEKMPENLNRDVRRFLAAIDPSKGIRRKVSRIYRIKALDFITDEDKPQRREFITVVEDWFGKRVDGTEVPPVSEHKNGVYAKLRMNPDGTVETTNDLIYYIPFSKENVDEWIDQSYSTDKESIQFWVDTKSGSRRKQFEYDDFVNKSWDELVEEIDKKPNDNRTIDTLTALVQKQQEQIDQLINKRRSKGEQ